MAIVFRNSLTRKDEPFEPIRPGEVRMYTCGPTVYDFAHIGNFRTFMFIDLLRRYLKYKGYRVLHVMNITDVDDKIIRDSQAKGLSLREFTGTYTQAFFDDLNTLGIERAEQYPAATDHIPEMVAMVQALVSRGMAYESGGSYYFKISAFADYGKLANLDMSGLKAGARVVSDEYEKESVSDFALWKAYVPSDGQVFWETPIGKGRPGWHLECSAMSMKYLGETFDIHVGGVDLLFPHHENEIAQAEGTTGKQFVRYWLHSEHLIVEGKKMSKSLGNFFTLRDLAAKGFSGSAIRYLLLSAHYRQQLNFTFDGLEAARNGLERYNDFIRNLKSYVTDAQGGGATQLIEKAAADFESALDADLNISGALGVVFDLIRDINRLKADNTLSLAERDAALALIRRFDTVLNFEAAEGNLDEEVESLIRQRTEARTRKDFARSDQIRDQLLGMGIILEDTKTGVSWKRKQ